MKKTLVLIPLVFLIFLSTGCSLIFTTRINSQYEKEIDILETKAIRVIGINGSLTILVWEKDYVRVTGTKFVSGLSSSQVKAFNNSLDVIWSNLGETLEIGLSRTDRPNGINYGVSMTVYVPRELYESHFYKTSNGSVSISGISGECVIESSNGNINITGFEGSIHSVTSNGGYKISHCRLYGNNHFKTSNGSVAVKLLTAPTGRLEIYTSNGKIDFKFPWTAGAFLTATTSNGNVDVQGFRSVSFKKIDKNDLRAEINSWGDLDLSLRTSNGDITLNGMQ
ncbi:MAG: hypothetical protein WAZ22_01250 [Mesotoga infera]|jgi:DUF4097 and DUF4098 domain-containing protein YvlB|nr:DUF4097 family beta strand repeat-containing protein [Candidatus Krumholzibacteria bacterium]